MISRIDRLIEQSRERLISLTGELVEINSEKGEAEENAPFGKGPKAVLEKMLEKGSESGFSGIDYNCGVASLSYENREIDLGIWLHGDVVPAGNNWNFPPFKATEFEGCLIGRGVTDNKGQLAVVFTLFEIFKKLGIKLNYNPAIYIGSNEETGMEDLKAFLKSNKPPRLSLVPDDGFPLGYGGKGGINVTFKSTKRLENISEICAGSNENPGGAVAVLKDGQKFEAISMPRHGSNPDKNGNMITKLSESLIECGKLSEDEIAIFKFLKDLSLDTEGKMLGIYKTSEEMGNTTVFSKALCFSDGFVEALVNIRYPIGITYEEISEILTKAATKKGFEISEIKRGVDPYLNDKDGKVAKVLMEASAEIKGDKPAYTLGGGTYAHRLPCAYVFGMDGNLPPESFEKGRGGAHGIDEAVSLKRLEEAMKIYARALLKLNETEW